MGDFNIDLLKTESCDFSNRFSEQLFTSSFLPLITRPTRITEHTATLIDNIFTNDLEQIESSKNGLVFSDISDHLPVFHIASFPTKMYSSKIETSQHQRIVNNASLLLFSNSVKDISLDIIVEDNDPSESYKNFHNKLVQAFDKSFPLVKRQKRNIINYDKSPWMTQGISKSIGIKNRLYKKCLKNPSEKNKTIYKNYKNKLKHLIKISKKDYFENQFIKYKNNSKMTWQTINKLLNRNKKKEKLSHVFQQKNSDINFSDPIVIANKFNEYFVNVGPNLAKGIRKNDTVSFEKYLKGNYRESMFAEPVTELEILTEIDNLNTNKSAGHDNISAKMIKTIKQEICKPLAHIFNLTFDTGLISE